MTSKRTDSSFDVIEDAEWLVQEMATHVASLTTAADELRRLREAPDATVARREKELEGLVAYWKAINEVTQVAPGHRVHFEAFNTGAPIGTSLAGTYELAALGAALQLVDAIVDDLGRSYFPVAEHLTRGAMAEELPSA